MNTRSFALLLAAGMIGASSPIANAGDLNPPAGPVAPTPGPEPRIAVNAANTPGDANSVYRITAAGSYYLQSNLSGAVGESCIEIAGTNITLDLNGYRLLGTVGSLQGIIVSGSQSNITIRNGSVRSFDLDGIAAATCDNVRLIDVTARNCGGTGVTIGTASTATNVIVDSNAQGGIVALNDCILTGCVANDNIGTGIACGFSSVISQCKASENSGIGIDLSTYASASGCSSTFNGSHGFNATNSVSIVNCTAAQNSGSGFRLIGGGAKASLCAAKLNGADGFNCVTGDSVENCIAEANAANGISTAFGSMVTGCNVGANGLHGILVTSNCIVRGNSSTENGTSGVGAGITMTSSDNRIEDNNCIQNDLGIRTGSSGNFIARNTCSGNTTLNWDIAANNKCLVIDAIDAPAISGDAGGLSPGSTNPNANYTY